MKVVLVHSHYFHKLLFKPLGVLLFDNLCWLLIASFLLLWQKLCFTLFDVCLHLAVEFEKSSFYPSLHVCGRACCWANIHMKTLDFPHMALPSWLVPDLKESSFNLENGDGFLFLRYRKIRNHTLFPPDPVVNPVFTLKLSEKKFFLKYQLMGFISIQLSHSLTKYSQALVLFNYHDSSLINSSY